MPTLQGSDAAYARSANSAAALDMLADQQNRAGSRVVNDVEQRGDDREPALVENRVQKMNTGADRPDRLQSLRVAWVDGLRRDPSPSARGGAQIDAHLCNRRRDVKRFGSAE